MLATFSKVSKWANPAFKQSKIATYRQRVASNSTVVSEIAHK